MDPFVGEVRAAGFNFAPQGWALCQGQILPIAQNTALFSLLGTNYGGNGTVTFALPNLQGIVPIGSGTGPGLSSRTLGEEGGEANVLLQANQVGHTHPMAAATGLTTQTHDSPVGRFPGKTTGNLYTASSTGQLEPSSVVMAGGGQPHNNMQPFLAINYIIALQGVFPQRS